MSQFPHLQIVGGLTGVPFTRPGRVIGVFRTPPRDRNQHALALRHNLNQATADAEAQHQAQGTDDVSTGIQLTLASHVNYPLRLESLELRRAGIKLLQAWTANSIENAVIFVPRTAFNVLLSRIDEYEHGTPTRSGAPRNQKLIESIERVRLAITEDLWSDARPFPETDAAMWWEVWSECEQGQAQQRHALLTQVCQQLGLEVSARMIAFSERVVTLVKARRNDWARHRFLLEIVAELRYPIEPARPYLDLSPREQGDWVRNLADRLTAANPDAPAVCLLDTGVNRGHALLQDSLLQQDVQAVDSSWGVTDDHEQQHGTCMAGTALFGDLADLLRNGDPVTLRHRLESVKIFPRTGNANPELYGAIFQQAVALAEIANPNRKRAVCLAVTAPEATASGAPSSWSAAVDQATFNDGQDTRLVIVSAGNIRTFPAGYEYPRYNHTNAAAIEDPSQAWNALTVGAFTERVIVQGAEYQGLEPIAPAGGLTPSSRTSACWDSQRRSAWPMKPDVVFEGGNWLRSQNGDVASCVETHLLTTAVHATGAQFDTNADTSAATAQAARLAALIQAQYPRLRAETIRAIIAHSAEWTPAMMTLCPGIGQNQVIRRIRTFGYGVPDLGRALFSLRNAVTLVAEGAIQPYQRNNGRPASNQMGVHELPWPRAVLFQLGDVPVRMRVTLSYFIEPNPGRRGSIPKTRYASHGLRFDVKRPGEDLDTFKQRLSTAEREDPDADIDTVGETRNWVVGANGRARGSLQGDWWEGTANELAASDHIAVFPVTGWWRERPHLGKIESPAPYSLVLSIETPAESIDLYTAITTQTEVPVEVPVQG